MNAASSPLPVFRGQFYKDEYICQTSMQLLTAPRIQALQDLVFTFFT